MTPSDPPVVKPAAIPLPESSGTPEPTTPAAADGKVPEFGGRRDGTDPTRFGDWEKGGRCIDF